MTNRSSYRPFYPTSPKCSAPSIPVGRGMEATPAPGWRCLVVRVHQEGVWGWSITGPWVWTWGAAASFSRACLAAQKALRELLPDTDALIWQRVTAANPFKQQEPLP